MVKFNYSWEQTMSWMDVELQPLSFVSMQPCLVLTYWSVKCEFMMCDTGIIIIFARLKGAWHGKTQQAQNILQLGGLSFFCKHGLVTHNKRFRQSQIQFWGVWLHWFVFTLACSSLKGKRLASCFEVDPQATLNFISPLRWKYCANLCLFTVCFCQLLSASVSLKAKQV